MSAGRPDPQAWGVAPGHHHVSGRWVPAPAEGERAALAAMRAESERPPPSATWVVTDDEVVRLPSPATLITEAGERRTVAGVLQSPPLGYHTLEFDDGPVRLIVSPGRCPRPERRAWGWAVQLYATRSSASWGIGDLGDLRRFGEWASARGASIALINPLHAVAPGPRPEASPYFPSSRKWRNPLYLRIEDIAGAGLALTAGEAAALAARGRALNEDRIIDRAKVWELKLVALDRLWTALGQRLPEAAEAWIRAQGASLDTFATFSALAEIHGPDWRRWPDAFWRYDGPAARRFASGAGAARVAFHGWLQWLLDQQLQRAADALPVIGDLAIGSDPGGADAWEWQDVLARGVSVGAPPDEFAPGGQDWGFPPFDPWRLRAAGYQPFVDLVRAALDHTAGVRLDHVAGLFRLYWVPHGADARQGVYVRYPWADLCNILALESHRAGAVVVGEDLGTVEDEARHALAKSGVLSYRVLWFEDRPPSEWPEAALAAVTTHDLPTVAGVCTGADERDRRAIGMAVDGQADAQLLSRLARAAGVAGLAAADVDATDAVDAGDAGDAVDAGATLGEVVLGAYRALAASPCLLVAATLEDALEIEERPNLPGTTVERPNWCLALPQLLETIEGDQRVVELADVLRAARPVLP